MAGSTWGEIFRISTWGESHGKGLGVVVDGCPAGLALSEEEIQKYLDKRKPGETRYSTPRKEGDKVEILSGVGKNDRNPDFTYGFQYFAEIQRLFGNCENLPAGACGLYV